MTLSSFLQLVRWKNLVMLALIQILFKYVYFPAFTVDTALSNFNFSILVFTTLIIAAAGNILNDIFDVEADKINKPTKVLVTKKISKKRAHFLYNIFNGVGLLTGLYLAHTIDKLSFVAIFVITILLLKVYNSDLKKRPIIGNIIVALLVSLSILIVGVFEVIPVVTEDNDIDQYYAFKVLIDYAAFAFMFMLLREMVKDVEDINGDKYMNMQTLPILLGRKRTNYIIFALSFVPLIIITSYSFNNFPNVPFVLAYMLIVVLLPLLYFMTKILYAKSKKDYKFASMLLKLIMLLGMFSIVILSLTIYYAG
ncbi:prenyltransferase [Aureibaculum marinum]|uniref:Prenyltransferase n=1 Tax=Aureibaculum marinum TaxID=2487930 RepID=A0A3N4NJA2_9FLAO|nr:geranylgeranylglycerol-phosphate geranylgeranyltransferase [Aureibaculum marinum]RPD94467.1 prenyltransferase [Aureibaculum marinum]